MSDPPDWSSDSELVGGRYQLLNRLGEGAMGTTHRALDRLSGRVVTVKRLKPGGAAVVGEPLTRSDYRLALAQEFRLLASLRHPNIVSVLDYGFDAARRPFFCMDLQENAQTIVDAGRQRPLLVRADLLVQLLRALVYLHRHGIIHCDIKPANVVVVDTQVKVLDFGLSVYGGLLEPEAAPLAGTPLYMAPELLRGARPSEASDLYSAGVLAYELFAGHLLPPGPEMEQVVRSGEGVGRLLRRTDGALDPRVEPIVARLLAGNPAERYEDASQSIHALAAALGQPFDSETVATRESLLQNAPLVGRDGELAVLAGRLRTTAAGRGGTVLLGGESGVGKSRLMEELRTRGLVDGFAVVGGQAVSEGGSPYHAWRDVVRGLAVRETIAAQAAGVLRAIVPDLPRLLGRPVADPPAVDPAAAQSRLLLAVEGLVRAQTQPVLILLEDLQWAGSESVALLAALARMASALPLLIVGSFRSDEAADFPEQVAGAEVILLPRLDARAIAELARAMMGPAGAQPQVAAFLEGETEGIPLFIVEAVRLLAESVGSLAEIGTQPLPPHLLSGGMRQVLQRRVERVPADGVPALRTAAVIGREIDPALLRLVHPRLDSDHWLRTCAAAAVVEVREQGGARFAHDKLREHVLGALAADQRAALHRQVALAIEAAYPNAPERDPALAHHWRLAGDAARELIYEERSAAQALAGGAYEEAIARFERALELIQDGGAGTGARVAASSLARLANPLTRTTTREPDLRRGLIEAGISESYYRLGDLRACERHALLALTTFGLGAPSGGIAWVAAIGRELVIRGAQFVTGRRIAVAVDPAVAGAIGQSQTQLLEAYFYSLRALPILWALLRYLNLTEPAGPSTDLSRAYVYLAVVSGVASLPRLAARWSRHAVAIAEGTATPGSVAYALNRSTALELGRCWWSEAAAHIRRAEAIASGIGDMRLCEEARTQAGILALYHGPLEPGLEPLQSAYELSRRSGSQQGACWSLLGRGDLLVRLGRASEAVPLYEEAIGRVDEPAMRTEGIWGHGGLALAWLRLDRPERAGDHVRLALGLLAATTPFAFWVQQGTAATAEVALALLERERGAGRARALRGEAARACAAMHRYARRFPLGRGHDLLWRGVFAWLTGHPQRARRTWRSAIVVAQALGLPYEQARAHVELGRHLPGDDPERAVHFDAARDLFAGLGCADAVARVERDRDHPADAGRPG